MKLRLYRLTGRLHFNRLSTRLLIYYLALFALSFCLICLFLYRALSRMVIQQELSRQTALLSQLTEAVDSRVRNALNFTSMVYNSPRLLERLLKTSGEDADTDLMDKYFFSLLSVNDYIFAVDFVADRDSFFTYRTTRRYTATDHAEHMSDWQSRLRSAEGRPLVLDIYVGGTDSFGYSSNNSYITIGRMIGNSTRTDELGMLIMDVDIQDPFTKYTGSFANNPYVRRPKTDARGSFIMVSGEGRVLVQTDNMDAEFIQAVLSKQEFSQEVQYKGTTYLVLSEKLGHIDWEMFYFLNKGQLLEELSEASFMIIGVAGLTAVASMLFLAAVMRRVSVRLGNFLDNMNRFKNGDMDIVIEDRHHDEISRLITGFNDMTQEIRRLIQQVYMLQLKQKEAEIKALEQQINPHFLYNTLENIRMLAVLSDQRDIAAMISSLGQIIRRNLELKGDYIALQEEVSFVSAYCVLMQMRFSNRFDFIVEIAPETQNKQILKFALQPLVENAIIHGIQDISRHGIIRLRSELCGADLHITISDNGIGMDAQTQEYVACLQQTESDSKSGHIGISNVNERIRLAYGAAYGLSFVSGPGEGTTITLVLPAFDQIPAANLPVRTTPESD